MIFIKVIFLGHMFKSGPFDNRLETKMGISIGNTNILFIYLFILWEINIGKLTHGFSGFWTCLVSQLKLTFSHFK